MAWVVDDIEQKRTQRRPMRKQIPICDVKPIQTRLYLILYDVHSGSISSLP